MIMISRLGLTQNTKTVQETSKKTSFAFFLYSTGGSGSKLTMTKLEIQINQVRPKPGLSLAKSD